MSRGPGRIERLVGETLRHADRSYTVEELAQLAYPGLHAVEKKHRVAVLRAIDNVAKRQFIWTAQTFTPPWRQIFTNGRSARSYGHGLLRSSWWNAKRPQEEIEAIFNSPEIQTVMEPGGFWWLMVEEHVYEREIDDIDGWIRQPEGGKTFALDHPNYPTLERLRRERDDIRDLRRRFGGHERINGDPLLIELLGKFEPPCTPAFNAAMEAQRA